MEVLVVDDDRHTRHVLGAALSRLGHTVREAADGHEALAILRDRRCRLVVSDWLMPGLDGLELCRRIRQTDFGGYVYVILVTGRGEADDLILGLTAGADDLLHKPLVPTELRLRVRTGERILANEQMRAEIAERDGIEAGLRAKVAELEAIRAQLAERNQALATTAQRLEQANAALKVVARQDSLTGVLNRGAWTEALRLEHARSHRYGHPYSLFMVDLDMFKLLNDTRGHLAGDECLRRVAAALRTHCRPSDLIGRYGGDEFVVLLPETALAGALELAERIRTAGNDLLWPSAAAAGCAAVTISIGLAEGAGPDWMDTLRQADAALYAAKREGRDRVCAAPVRRTTGQGGLWPARGVPGMQLGPPLPQALDAGKQGESQVVRHE